MQRAIGDRLTCVFVDHGLLRACERAQVQRDFVAATGANLVTVDAADRFLEALGGVTNPEGKRKIIGRQFIRAFEGAVRDIVGEWGRSPRKRGAHPLAGDDGAGSVRRQSMSSCGISRRNRDSGLSIGWPHDERTLALLT